MSCRGCKKGKKRFKKMVEEKKTETQEVSDYDKHFMLHCEHGVPHGAKCLGCNKIISIPEDAKIQVKKEE